MKFFRAHIDFGDKFSAKGCIAVCESLEDWSHYILDTPKWVASWVLRGIGAEEIFAVLNPTSIDWKQKRADLRQKWGMDISILEEVQ
ncbi:MAG: hypothetical protein NC218_03265 [Acetobacter sp.]|nr:hypothetical protein [Acetobacter sp.]